MIAATWISMKHDLVSISDYQRITNIVEDYGLPARIPNLETSEIINAMYKDKKTEHGQIKFVLPTGIGRAPVLRYVGEETIRMALEENW
jgi:3-dehydroquinate synthase